MNIKLPRTLSPYNTNYIHSVTLNIILSSVNSNLCFNFACQKMKDFFLCLMTCCIFWALHLGKKTLKVCEL